MSWVQRHGAFSWGEPASLRAIEYRKPNVNEEKFGQISIAEHDSVRQLINEQIFAGQLRWVNLKDLKGMRDTLRKKHPGRTPSRQLPLLRLHSVLFDQFGVYRVHVTDHGISGPKRGSHVEGTLLASRPYYAFWVLPEQKVTWPFPVYFVGMGYLEESKIPKVEAHLQQALSLSKQAVKPHI